MMKFTADKMEIIRRITELEDHKPYQVEIKEPKSKRSLEQNRLLWSLIHLIAKKTHQDDMDVYCAALERADAKSEYVITAFEMTEALRKQFRGAVFIRMQEVNGKDCYVYKVYIGSSKMNIKEMTELIDICYQICAEQSIPTIDV